uniref:DUF6534 domain-containing protein n=2 Tax=Moniliophthora roreri TaxID=221103 RepID=A0A0W0FKW1_MONRR
MTSTEQAHLTVDNTMGAAFIGVICAACLYGVSCVQTWFYFNRYSYDVWYIKLLVKCFVSLERRKYSRSGLQVLVVWILDSIHQGLISHTVYFYVVTNYTNAAIQADLVWSVLKFSSMWDLSQFSDHTNLLLMTVTGTDWTSGSKFPNLAGLEAEQRERSVDRDHWSAGTGRVCVFRRLHHQIVGHLCMRLVSPGLNVNTTRMKLVTWEDLTQLRGLSMTVNVLGAVSDVFIATGLFFFLHRSRTGFKKSDTMISKLIMFSVSTGLLTSICAIASLLSILVWGDTLIYVAFYFSLGRLYSNSLLATLNARQSIRGLTDETGGELSFSLQTFTKSRRNKRDIATNSKPANISIKIDTTHEMVRDRIDTAEDINSSVTEKSFKDIEKRTLGEYSSANQ